MRKQRGVFTSLVRHQINDTSLQHYTITYFILVFDFLLVKDILLLRYEQHSVEELTYVCITILI